MRLFIFHYHLNPGGVTRIIESQILGLKQVYPQLPIRVVTGGCQNPVFFKDAGVELLVNPKLNYLENTLYKPIEILGLFDELFQWIKQQITLGDVLHFHNLNLGKNPLLTRVFYHLAQEGYLVLNHAHDFAEDRPINIDFMQKIIGNYFHDDLRQVMYPDFSNYKFGVLNRFDYQRLVNRGIPQERLFLFPNPVALDFDNQKTKLEQKKLLYKTFQIPEQKQIITYPVRVIQRKNIGELILLAGLFKDAVQFLVTLAPLNPVEKNYYEDWKIFCSENDISIIFEAGSKIDFETLIGGSDYCITTSIQEGFGMAYLEPWLAGTPVVGRNIDSVTRDLIAGGISFPLLYDALKVPFCKNTVDFKTLAADKQKQVISGLLKEYKAAKKIKELNPYLNHFPPPVENKLINQNIRIIKQKFGIEHYAKRLYQSYQPIS